MQWDSQEADYQSCKHANKSKIEIYILPKNSNILQNLDPLQSTWIYNQKYINYLLQILSCSLFRLPLLWKMFLFCNLLWSPPMAIKSLFPSKPFTTSIAVLQYESSGEAYLLAGWYKSMWDKCFQNKSIIKEHLHQLSVSYFDSGIHQQLIRTIHQPWLLQNKQIILLMGET